MAVERPSCLLVFGLALIGQVAGHDAVAQTALASPNRAVDAPAKIAPKKTRPASWKTAAAARAKAAAVSKAPPPLAPWAAVDPGRAASAEQAPPPPPAETKSTAASAAERLTNAKLDPTMKWTGTSDGSAQTHYQNGLDGAFGLGGEVGMKLNF